MRTLTCLLSLAALVLSGTCFADEKCCEKEQFPIAAFVSVDAGLGVQIDFAKEIGLKYIQMHTPSKEARTPEKAAAFKARLKELGLTPLVVFCGFEGESYADIPTTKKTIGLVPPETRAARFEEVKEIANFAKAIGCDVVGIHIGFIPLKSEDPKAHEDLVKVAQELCDYLASQGQRLHLETGQETADGLLAFLEDVNRPNLFVNFDPANMILYGSGEPIEALKKIGKYVRSVHAKDALWAKNPGKEWGQEVPFGQGQVNARKFIETLKEVGYTGPITIEREIPDQPERQKKEIIEAKNLIESIAKELK